MIYFFLNGSSPRMRGKLADRRHMDDMPRIIPAHAGQTLYEPYEVPSPSDHPRACGANGRLGYKVTRITGSSPRMRGKPRQPAEAGFGFRIIPAHAGQTTRAWNHPNTTSDHPRACGANWALSIARPATIGSSPRMRGKRDYPIAHYWTRRIIPAHAGQTGTAGTVRIGHADHPRACGANVPPH